MDDSLEFHRKTKFLNKIAANNGLVVSGVRLTVMSIVKLSGLSRRLWIYIKFESNVRHATSYDPKWCVDKIDEKIWKKNYNKQRISPEHCQPINNYINLEIIFLHRCYSSRTMSARKRRKQRTRMASIWIYFSCFNISTVCPLRIAISLNVWRHNHIF